MFISKLLRIKSFYDFHGLAWKEEEYKSNKFKSIFFRFLENICLSHYDHIVSQTETNMNLTMKFNKNCSLIENGIVSDDFSNPSKNFLLSEYNIDSKSPIVGFIGNWEHWMKIEDLLEASKYLKNVKIMVVGRGHSFDEYKRKYPNVIFTGRVRHKEALGFMSCFKVCVSPHSKDEIMIYKSAVKTFEYMAAGKPLIVSNVAGKENFLVEGVNCLFYEPENPRSLAEKVEILLSDEELMTKFSYNNKKLSKKFTWDKRVQKSGLIELLN